jgi:hypothetical protein
MKDEKLYIHAGYDSQHNVLHDLVEVDISSGACHYPRPRTTHRYSPLRASRWVLYANDGVQVGATQPGAAMALQLPS